MQPLESRTYSVPVVLQVLAVLLAIALGVGALVAFVRVRLLGVWAVAFAGAFTSHVLGRIPWSITVRGDGRVELRTLRSSRTVHVTEITAVGFPVPGSIDLRLPDGRVWTPVRRARSLAADLEALYPPLATSPG